MLMELIKLFLIFFQIGLFTFGGGYAMIPLIRSEIAGHGYLTIQQIDQFIGISESTPGPFAINMATFVGYHSQGILGAFVTNLGVVLPSFIIISLIAYFSAQILAKKPVRSMLAWINPLTVGLILSAAISVSVTALFSDYPWREQFNPDVIGIGIFVVIFLVSIFFKKLNPIHLILLSALLGFIGYSIL